MGCCIWVVWDIARWFIVDSMLGECRIARWLLCEVLYSDYCLEYCTRVLYCMLVIALSSVRWLWHRILHASSVLHADYCMKFCTVNITWNIAREFCIARWLLVWSSARLWHAVRCIPHCRARRRVTADRATRSLAELDPNSTWFFVSVGKVPVETGGACLFACLGVFCLVSFLLSRSHTCLITFLLDFILDSVLTFLIDFFLTWTFIHSYLISLLLAWTFLLSYSISFLLERPWFLSCLITFLLDFVLAWFLYQQATFDLNYHSSKVVFCDSCFVVWCWVVCLSVCLFKNLLISLVAFRGEMND